MNKSQENRFSMHKTVETYLDGYQTIISGIPELQSEFDLFKSKNNQIINTDTIRNNVLSGKTISKHSARKDVMLSAIAVAGGINALARKTKNEVLKVKSNIKKADLKRMRDAELLETLDALKELSQELAADITAFGVTADKMTVFTQRINTCRKAAGDKDNSKVAQAGSVKTLVTLFTEANEILYIMDNIIKGMSEEEPVFTGNYFIARGVNNLGIRHRKAVDPVNAIAN